MFKLSRRSISRLVGVHPHLADVVTRAIELTIVDFAVLEGLRTVARQRELVDQGASTTMNSRHLTGHAVDLGAWDDGKISWHWPLYYRISDAMFEAADELHIPIEWGGMWDRPDGPHYQLPWSKYPI